VAFEAGSRLLAEDLTTTLSRLLDPPGAQLRQTVAQSITHSTFTAITFTTEDYDNQGGHSTTVNTSRYTCQVAGRYLISGKVAFVSNTTGRRGTQWRVNGSQVQGSQVLLSSGDDADETQYPALTMTVLLAVNDYVELFAIQQSGGSLNTSVTDAHTQSVMQVRWTGTT
jgi:hypothetical protein